MNYGQLDLFEGFETHRTIAEKIAQYGIKGLNNTELVSELIRPYISSKCDIAKMTTTLLEAMNSNNVPTLASLTSIKGVSDELASGILIALELGRRKGDKTRRQILTPEDIYKETYHFANEEQEHFIVMALNGAGEIIYTNVVTIGLVNRTLAHPREVFAEALKERAIAIVLVHNHPSGSLEPSTEDIKLTESMVKSGRILGIKVLDHLVISKDGFYSFAENDLI